MKRIVAIVLWLTLLFCEGFTEQGEEGFTEQGKEETQHLVTNIFLETDIRQALRDISAQTEVLILPDNTVQGMVSLDVRKIPLEQCLERILAPGGYVFTKIDDYYLVGSPHLKNPSFRNLSFTEYVKLKYIKPSQVLQVIPKMFEPYVEVVKEKDLVMITAPDKIRVKIKECIENTDIAPVQVMIEAIVTEVSYESMKRYGIDWSWEGNKNIANILKKPSGKVTMNNLITNVTCSNPGGVTKNVLATLKLLVQKGEAKIRANPRIVAQENEEATIYIGKEKYYSIAPGDKYSYGKLEMIKSGITLKIKPRINNDEITVVIRAQVSDVSGGEESWEKLPLINNREVKTEVRVKNGEPIVIGGLLQQDEREGISRIPILSKVPIINFFFKNIGSSKSKNEVVILITPQILKEKNGNG